jgi:hypothetical protein
MIKIKLYKLVRGWQDLNLRKSGITTLISLFFILLTASLPPHLANAKYFAIN